MSQQHSSHDNLHKRRRTEPHSLDAKRRRLDGRSTGSYSLFWDGLSKIWLTKDALREFDRRTSRSTTQSTPQRVCPAKRPVTRKFLADSRNHCQRKQTADEFLHNCTPGGLKSIRRFARGGGIDLSDLRGMSYPEPIPSHSFAPTRSSAHSRHQPQRPSRGSSSSRGRSRSTTTSTTTTMNSRPKDANYHQKLIDGHAYPYGYEFPNGSGPPLPNEWDELSQRLAQRRPSLPPSAFPEEEYRNFVRQDARALTEDAVKDTVFPALLRAMGVSDGAQKNVLFTNMDPLVPGISQATPDCYYGAQPEQIHQQVHEDLSGCIVPSTASHCPTVPNFSLEAIGPLGSNREALLQACHVGAIGTRAMHSLENYRQDSPEYHGKVSSISSTYYGGIIKMYGHSVAQPNGPGTQPHYYMHQLKAIAMTGLKVDFWQGATAFRNARDWTAGIRNAAIANANAIAAAWTEEREDDEEEKEGETDSTPAFQSFASSSLGEEEGAEESATSDEGDDIRRPPAKRYSRRSAGSDQRKRNQLQ